MAQVIRPEVWQEGIDDNRLLPSRYTTDKFIGSGVKIANNNDACRVYDIVVPDYITYYDDRRLNGHNNFTTNNNFNADGRDGWGASAYGVFQDVRFDSRVYTMGRHRSVALRLFDEMQYSGGIYDWGTDSTSNVITNGNALMKTAQLLSRTKDLWDQAVLGPDIDRYNLFCACTGHISGLWVQDNPDTIFSDQGQWVAQPGTVEGSAIPPRFAPIHAIEWDDDNIPLLLQTIKVTWNNLYVPQDNRIILIDPFYEYPLLAALTGNGVPVTESGYNDIKNGSFTRLMGWDFDFTIPSEYWPHIYVDDNLNVIHSADGKAAYDAVIRSVNHSAAGDRQLMLELAESDRMNRPNYGRTIWDPTTGKFRKILTNYPLGMPGAADYYGPAIDVTNASGYDYNFNLGGTQDYPWTAPGGGYGLPPQTGNVSWEGANWPNGSTGPVIGGNTGDDITGTANRYKVIGLALYKKAVQLSQEYSEMKTEDGGTRGKFTEMVFDVKYDAWVIEGLSAGILPIIDTQANRGTFAVPVKIVNPGEIGAGETEETPEP